MAELQISELDFDSIKDNIRTYLRQQTEFQDYDFDGSAMSVLIDTLAYNTFYNSFNTNLVSNELFLDTAQLRSNVINKAKQLNYIAGSKTSARATVNVTVTAEDLTTSLTIPEYTNFQAGLDGQTYNFVTTQSYTTTKGSNDTSYYFEGIEITQGEIKEDVYYYDALTNENKFILLDKAADVSTLRVYVSDGETFISNDEWKKSTNYVAISADDRVYWLSQDLDENYFVSFGDDIIGKKLPNNQYVILQYLKSEGKKANSASEFELVDLGLYDETVVTLYSDNSFAGGGTDEEDIESIRFNAPKFFQTQNRAITANDYSSILKANYNNIKSINSWGGEDNDPPEYGKVFVSIQPQDALFLSDSTKNFLINLLKKYSPVSTRVEIIDPIYTYITFDVILKYDSRATNQTENDIKQKALTSTISYVDDNVSKYDTYFRYSKYVNYLDNIDPAITSNITKIKMKQFIYPSFVNSNNFTVFFNNALYLPNGSHKNAITSSRFSYSNKAGSFDNCYIRSINTTLNVTFVDSSGVELVVESDIGKIDAALGTLTFDNFSPTSSANADGSVEIYAQPDNFDIIPLRNQIITSLESDVNISVIDDNKIILQSQEGNIASY